MSRVPAIFLFLVGSLLLTSGSGGAPLHVANASLPADSVVPGTRIESNSTVLMPVTFFLDRNDVNVMLLASIRWFPANPATTWGNRVARIRIDGTDVEPLAIADSRPGGLTQFSTGLTYVARLGAGWHTVAVHFGTCCSSTSSFVVGNESRLDVVWSYPN